MNLTKKQKTIKYAVYCLLILAGGLLQNVHGLWLEIGNARCFFLIPFPILLGINEDERVSALLGLFAGLLWDFVAVQHMGYNLVFLTLICYIASALVSYLLRATFWVKFGACSIATILYCLIYWLLFVVPNGSTGDGASFGYFYIPCIIYTMAISFLLCLVSDSVTRFFNHEQKLD